MTRTEKVAASMLKPINPTLIVILGVYTIVWGLWIVSPFWTVFTQAPLYQAMMGVGSETFWGSLAIVSGAITVRGALKPSYYNLLIGSFVSALHWLIIGIFYFMGDWMNTGGITAITFAAYAAIVWVNIKVNADHFDQ